MDGITGMFLADIDAVYACHVWVSLQNCIISSCLTSEVLNIDIVNNSTKLDAGTLGEGQGLDCDGRHGVWVVAVIDDVCWIQT